MTDNYVGMVKAYKNLFFFYQKDNQSNTDYHNDFMSLVEVIEEYGGAGCLTHFPMMIKKELLKINPQLVDPNRKPHDRQKVEAKQATREKFLATLMLYGANGGRYRDLQHSIAENFVASTGEYLDNPQMVLRIMNAYQPPQWNQFKRRGQDGAMSTDEGAMFAQVDSSGRSHDWKANIVCHKCGKKGHFAWECSSNNKDT